MATLSDEALLAGLASGDPDDAAAFVRRFQRRVYGLAWTIVRDDDLADEVAQETFVRAWRHAAGYDPRRGRVTAWLLTIARNVAIDRARMRRIAPADPDVIASALELADRDTMPDVGERDRVQRALATLPDEQRRALVLAVYAGRTAREISEIDGVPLGTVKTRIRTAMATMRETLGVVHDV
jgi:RNA polymerase sigma-70 factor (ECF subfamily)